MLAQSDSATVTPMFLAESTSVVQKKGTLVVSQSGIQYHTVHKQTLSSLSAAGGICTLFRNQHLQQVLQ